MLKSGEADALGQQLVSLVERGQIEDAYALLAPLLVERTPFRLLDRIGVQVGAASPLVVNSFLERISQDRALGSYPVIGAALAQQLERDFEGALGRAYPVIITRNVWYVTDIIGERVHGSALVLDLPRALRVLNRWRIDPNDWARRSLGVGVHVWAKRLRGAPASVPDAGRLLGFLEPMFEEREMDAIKGIGWGLKTLGRYYPDLVAPWLEIQVKRPHRALMLTKAITYLPPRTRAHLLEAARS